MQTTLLGLAIAFILALIAALVGPYFIDWNQFRSKFEAEATRVIGAPVRVGGELDARLLPTPSLRLRSVSIGAAKDASRAGADKLDVEFSLSSLMRGEWRATELTLNGFALDLSLDDRGRMIWPRSAGSFDLGALSIDRLNLTGRAALHDNASGSTVQLNDIAFSGDVRALAGAARGDGSFSYHGVRYPFRLSSGRSADGSGTRLHLSVDPGELAFSADLEGVVSADSQVPRFDGSLVVSRAITLRAGDTSGNLLQTPWKVSTKVKASPESAKFEMLEATYGSDEVGLKWTGGAEVSFGATPSLHAMMSARQLDADRLLTKETAGTEPTRLISGLRSLVTAISAPPMASRIEISTDTVTLGARPVQNIAAVFRGDTDGWMIERMDGRAPGVTQFGLTGRLAAPGANAIFQGQLNLESADPDSLATWLRGQADSNLRIQKPLHATGAVNITHDRILFDTKVDADGRTADLRLALSDGAGGKGTKLDIGFKTDRADLAEIASSVRSFAGSQPDWPDEMHLLLDIGQGAIGGQTVSPVVADIGYDPASITLGHVNIGGTGGIALEGDGAFDRTAMSGRLNLNADSPSLSNMTKILAPALPAALAIRLNAVSDLPAPASAPTALKFSIDIDKADKADRANVRAKLDIKSAQLAGTMAISASPLLAGIHNLDIEAFSRGEANIDIDLSAPHGDALVTLLGLDQAVRAGDDPARLNLTAGGMWKSPVTFKAKMSGGNLDADALGTIDFWASEPKASVNLAVRKSDVAPLLDTQSKRAPEIATLSSRVTLAGTRLAFDDIDSTVAGSRIRGRFAITRDDQPSFAGEIGDGYA